MDLAFEEAERAENLMLHEDEIAARPARTWYLHRLMQSLLICCPRPSSSHFLVLFDIVYYKLLAFKVV